MLFVTMNVVLGLSFLCLSVALGYALVLSGALRQAAILHMPEPWRSNLSVIFFSLWMVVLLMATSSVVRLVYAAVGVTSNLAVALTGIVTAMSVFTCFNVTKACLVLRKAA